jgi:Ni/Co efflux regulator RcnB
MFMRILLAAAILSGVVFSSAASAQSEKEIRKDQHAVEAGQSELTDAQQHGNAADVEKAQDKLQGAHNELSEDRSDQQTSRYHPPYRNWSQSTPALGTLLRPKFYDRRYVISNPDHYRLETPAADQRWIRYGDDVLLVDVTTGRVADVLPRRYRDM